MLLVPDAESLICHSSGPLLGCIYQEEGLQVGSVAKNLHHSENLACSAFPS